MYVVDNKNELMHYGTKRHSGRYPYGSGDRPYQHEPGFFLKEVKRLKKEGLTEKEIASYFNLTVREFKAEYSLAFQRNRENRRAEARTYLDQGMKVADIARKMDMSDSTVRSLLKDEVSKKYAITKATIETLENGFKDHKYIDVGDGVAASLGITDERLSAAVRSLVDEGYVLHNVYVEQPWAPKKFTTVKVLCQPGTSLDEVNKARGEIGILNAHFSDKFAVEADKWKPVQSVDSKRIEVAYSSGKDGVIEIRRGVKDLDLGNSLYAQVRIGVDGTHYLKGMAIYADDLPDGVDIRFNTNKKKGTPLLSSDPDAKQVLKTMKGSTDNPLDAFGTAIQKVGGQRGAINIVYEEGAWGEWSKTIASQVLSKQSTQLAKRQLDAARLAKQVEYEEIMALTNPTLRADLLRQFGDKCERAATELKAASIPKQATHVILPVESLPSDKIYAPNYHEGEHVVLIRYPHGGTFEIPELTVTHRNKEASGFMKNAKDAVGISPATAAQLSGADFDGDTVLVIPDNDHKFRTSPARKELQEFDPKAAYPLPAGGKRITEVHKNKEMGVVTNLITDMSVKGAKVEEIIPAVKYSMVVIDSYKHKLDYRQARKDFGIEELRQKWQAHPDGSYGGASTLVSKSTATQHIPEVKKSYKPDPQTGEYTYTKTGRTYVDYKTGKTVVSTTKMPGMMTVRDARDLSSGTPIESVYANYANSMKALASQARKESINTKAIEYSPSAAKKYAPQVASLQSKVKDAIAHSPIERKAQLLADAEYRMRKEADPDMTKEMAKKIKTQALTQARASLGSRPKLKVTDQEWEAIQSGAVKKTTVEKVLRYADPEAIKKRAMPRDNPKLTPAKLALAKHRLEMGYPADEVAEFLGVSASTMYKALKG